MEARLIERYLAKRESILAQAQKKAEEIISEASDRARRLLSEGQEEQRRITGTDVRAIRDKILGQAQQEGRRELMQAREELIDRLFDEVKSRLQEVVNGENMEIDYHEVLLRLIAEAASVLGEEQIVISLNRRDREYISLNLTSFERALYRILGSEKRILIEDVPVDCIGGVVVSDTSKRKIYYNTFDSRIQTARNKLAAHVARSLGVI